jgi:hypothetical protein
MPPGEQQVGDRINDLAARQINWDTLSFGNREYLSRVMNISAD